MAADPAPPIGHDERVLDAPTRSRVRPAVEVAYVATVAILAIIATSDPNDMVRWAFIAAIVLCLPSMVPMLPIFYEAAGTAWNVTGADNGGTTWPVTATYVAIFTVTAVLNVWIAGLASQSRQRRRDAQASTP